MKDIKRPRLAASSPEWNLHQDCPDAMTPNFTSTHCTVLTLGVIDFIGCQISEVPRDQRESDYKIIILLLHRMLAGKHTIYASYINQGLFKPCVFLFFHNQSHMLLREAQGDQGPEPDMVTFAGHWYKRLTQQISDTKLIKACKSWWKTTQKALF